MRAPIGAETVILRSPSPTGAQAGGDRRMRLHPSSRAAKRLPSALRIITRMVARFSAFRAEEIKKKSARELDRKSTRLNSSHQIISYAVFCLKKNTIMLRRL